MDPIIRLHNVIKHYQSAGHHVSVLEAFNLEVGPGEFLALMGPSGAGKTTILHLIGGLDCAQGGTVMVAGARLDSLSQVELARWRAAHIGFVFQSHYLMPMLTAAANVEMPLLLTRLPRRARKEKVAAALARVGLADRATHKPGELSGGQQQRVAIARALIAGAPILLCDEPTAGLDRAMADSILTLLSELRSDGRTIVMVTHDANAAAFAGRILSLAPQAAAA